MAAGPRHHLEEFEDYRERLKVEAAELKRYLKGRLIWCSAIIRNDGTEFSPNPRKIVVKGQYKR